jgi:hypothetical protein
MNTRVDFTAPSLVPTVNGYTVRSFSTHGQQSAAKGSSTTVSRSDLRLIEHFDSSALWSDGPEVALIVYFPILYIIYNPSRFRILKHTPRCSQVGGAPELAGGAGSYVDALADAVATALWRAAVEVHTTHIQRYTSCES